MSQYLGGRRQLAAEAVATCQDNQHEQNHRLNSVDDPECCGVHGFLSPVGSIAGLVKARDENVLALVRRGPQLPFKEWADFFLEHYFQPPFRSTKTHAANHNALKQLKPVFGLQTLSAISAEDVEEYLRWRLRQQKRVKTRAGYRELGLLKPATVHQEFRVLRRVLNVAVKKKFVAATRATPWSFRSRSRGCSGRTTCPGRNSSGSSSTRPRTCAT